MLSRTVRTLLHAVIAIIAVLVIAPGLARLNTPLSVGLLSLIAPAGFLPFAVGLAAGLNADRLVLLTLVAVILLASLPHAMVPNVIGAGIGIGVGAMLRSLILSEATRATPQQPPQ